MRAKGIFTAVLAAGVLLLAPGFNGARADQYHRHGHGHQPSYHGKGHAHGWWAQKHFGHKGDGGYAYGKRTRNDFRGLSHQDHRKLEQIRHRFHNERAFRHYLRHHKPGLFARYMAHNHQRHQVHKYQRPQRYVWYRGQTLQLR